MKSSATLEKAQMEYGTDIFGFGNAFKYKKEWKEIRDRWNEEFVNVEVNIAVDAHLRRTGLLTKRASVKE